MTTGKDAIGIDVNIITVTPELASQWLKKNTHNRNLRHTRVRGLATDMKNGNWKWNGEAVKFAHDGTLLDGQHRLAAIVMSETPIKMLVINNVDLDTQHTMDTGAKRTPGDMLKLRGEKSYNVLASGIRACIVWESGFKTLTGSGSGSVITNTQILNYLEDHPEMREYASGIKRLSYYVRIPSSTGMVAHKIFYEIDKEDADAFFNRLASAEGHYKGEPIYALRQILLSPDSVGRNGLSPNYKLAVMIKAWNKFRKGEQIQQLRFRAGGANPEKFPEPI